MIYDIFYNSEANYCHCAKVLWSKSRWWSVVVGTSCYYFWSFSHRRRPVGLTGTSIWIVLSDIQPFTNHSLGSFTFHDNSSGTEELWRRGIIIIGQLWQPDFEPLWSHCGPLRAQAHRIGFTSLISQNTRLMICHFSIGLWVGTLEFLEGSVWI